MKTQNNKGSSFIKDLLRNLGLLLLIGIALFVIFPEMMRQVFQVYGALFTPALIVILILVAALPRKRRR